MSTVDGGIVNVAYPSLSVAFETDTSTVLWVTVAFWVTNVGLLLTLGWLGDVAGRRRVFTAGFVVFTLGMLMSAVSLNVWHLIGSRIVQGVGSSMLLSNLNAFITASFPAGERGKAMGVSGAVVGVGLAAGPLIGGFLLDVLDWRALFYTRAPLGVLGAALGWSLLPRDPAGIGRFRIDLIGAGALFGTMAAFLLVVNQGGRLGFTSTPVIGMAIAATIFTPLLVWTQRRAVRPILELSMFRIKPYAFSLGVTIGHYISHGAIMLVAPFYLMDSLGFSATKMGLFIATFYIGRTFVAPAAGWLSDKFGPRLFLILGNSMLAVALLWLSRQGTDATDAALLWGMLLAGAGSGFFEPVVTSVIMGSVPPDRLGTASASIAMARHIAFSVGVTLAGAVFAIRERVYLSDLALKGPQELVEARAIALGFGDAVLAGVALAVLAVVLSTRVRAPAARLKGE